MTKREALAEARRRWGSDGWVRQRPLVTGDCVVGKILYKSGAVVTGMSIRGRGDTWDTAFADADRREKGAKA